MKYLLAIILTMASLPCFGAVNYGHGGNPFAPVYCQSQDISATSSLNVRNQNCGNNRIPNNCIITSNGKLLSFVECRNTTNDANTFAIGLRISNDEGSTWGPIIEIVTANPPTSSSTIRLAMGAAFELPNGKVVLTFSYWTAWSASPSQAAARGLAFYEVISDDTDYETWTDGGLVTGGGPTDISTNTIKTDNSTPADLPSTLAHIDDAWVYGIMSDAQVLSNGDAIVTGVVRYTDVDKTYQVTWKRTSAGTWSIQGGLDESNATHEDMNESTLALVNNGTYLLCVMRDRGSGPHKWCRSSDNGVTWNDANGADSDDIGDVVSTISGDVQPDMCVDPSDDSVVYMSLPEDSVRARQTVWQVSVTSGVPDFDGNKRTFFEGLTAYPGIVCFDSGQIVLLTEAVANPASYTNGIQYILSCRFKAADLAVDDSPIHHVFTERTSGAMKGGPSVLSTAMDHRAFGNTAWSYGATGAVSDGSTGLKLANAINSTWGCGWSDRQDTDTTFEFVISVPNLASGGTTQTIASNYAGSGKGWELFITKSTGQVSFYVTDNSASALTVAGPIAGGVITSSGFHHVAVVYDESADTYTVIVDGVSGTETANTESGSLANATQATLGVRADGTTNPIASGTIYGHARIWRKDANASDELLTASSARKSLTELTNLVSSPYAPTTLHPSSCKMWLATFADGGSAFSGDVSSPIAPLGSPPDGNTGMRYVTDLVNDVSFVGTSFFRPILIGSDSTVGPFLYNYLNTSNGAGGVLELPGANTTWDFIQQDMTFTILVGAVRFDKFISSADVIFDNRKSTASNPGFTLYRDSNRKMFFGVSYDVSQSRISATTTTSFTEGTWYAMMIVGNGDGNAVNFYYTTWPGSKAVPTSWTGTASLGTAAGDDGTSSAYTSDQTPHFGTRTDGLYPGAISIKDFMIFDEALTAAEGLELLKNVVYVSRAPLPGGHSIGIGISLGTNDQPKRLERVPDEFTLAP